MIDPETGELKRSIFKEMRLNEISAVDRPAQPGARAVIMKRKPKKGEPGHDEEEVAKQAALTGVQEGHSHSLMLERGDGEVTSGVTSWEVSEGEVEGHSHPWIRTESGEIVIGTSDGHDHVIETIGKKQADAGAPDSADASDTTSGETADTIGNVQKEASMSDKNEETVDNEAVAKQLEDLQKRAERAEAVAQLNDAQTSIFTSLDVEKQDEFLALTPEQRNAEVAKAAEANAVVYTDSSGIEYRKNDDQRLVQLAKRADEERTLRVEAEKRQVESDLAKRATEFEHIPGNVIAILKGIDTLEGVEKEEALTALKAQDASLGEAFKRRGTSEVPETSNALEAITKRIASENPELTPEQAMAKALETPEGEKAYAESLGL